jgi:hypothetical protein
MGTAVAPLDRADQLARACEALRRGELLPVADAAWLSEALNRYLNEAATGATLEDTLGLAPTAPGEEHWTTTQRRKRRDAAIRAIRGRAPFADFGIKQAAREIAALGCRLQHSGRPSQPMPAMDQEIQLLLDEALRTGHRFPGPKQIVNILEIK